jgi:hypothetical protein
MFCISDADNLINAVGGAIFWFNQQILELFYSFSRIKPLFEKKLTHFYFSVEFAVLKVIFRF